MSFAVGDVIKARHAGKFMYKKAVITGLSQKEDHYSVTWDDGHKESDVPADKIIPFKSDEEILAEREEFAKTFAPPVVSERKFVPKTAPRARSPPRGPVDREGAPLAVGQRVEARYKGRGSKYYPGMITAIGPEGFGIKYDDGDEETGAQSENIIREIIYKNFNTCHGPCAKMAYPRNH